LGSGQLLFGAGLAVYGVNLLSLRQALTPARLQGRMHASVRFVVTGTISVGGLVGGILGERIGLRETLLIGAIGGCCGLGWLIRSPLRTLRVAPTVGEA